MRRCAAFALAILLSGWTARAAAPNTQTPTEDPAWQMGLCQCIADRTSRKLFCSAGAARCQTTCASALYAFVPLGQAAFERCAPTELYVVLPNADGRPGSGAINVSQGGHTALLDKPYAAAAALNGATANIAFDQNKVDAQFSQAIGARPVLPKHFRLFFESGSDRITAGSAAEFQAILNDINRRPVYEVDLVGHTDTVADVAENKLLSLNRAQFVKQALIRAGIGAGTIATAGRGETQPLVPTTNNIPEPKNRRVEVTVR